MPRDRSFWVLAAIWLLVTMPLAWLAARELEITIRSLQGVGGEYALPILTQWYQSMGTSGLFLGALAPGFVALILRSRSASPAAIALLTLVVVASLYFVFLALLAALLAYVKVSF